MSAHYIQKYSSTSEFLARSADRSGAAGLGVVSGILYANVSGVAIALADISTAQTLTNKTLTSPTINSAVGVQASEVTIATRVLLAAESGLTLFLNAATEFVTTLPAPALGLHYTVIVAAAPSGASYTVVTSGSANIIKGNQNSVAGDAGDFGTADDTVSFVDGQSVAGDKCEFYSDGTSWFAYAISKVAAGITFTQAS